MPRPPHGGPRGGFGGPQRGNIRGPMMGPEAHYYYKPITPAPTGNVLSGGETLSETLASYTSNTKTTFEQAFVNRGIFGGIITGIRRLTSGQLRYSSFVGKIATYDRQLAEGRITSDQCKIRKMQAAKKFNGYLLKIGYINKYDYQLKMEEFANQLGVNYINDSQGRTK